MPTNPTFAGSGLWITDLNKKQLLSSTNASYRKKDRKSLCCGPE